MTDISIIIATASDAETIAKTLKALCLVNIPSQFEAEILLVDNGAPTGLDELTVITNGTRFELRLEKQPLRGKSKALNKALGLSKGKILIFTDDDLRFPPDWITTMTKPIIDGKAEAVAGGVALAPHLTRSWMNHTHRAWLASTADYLHGPEPEELCGANMAMSRKVFEKIAGFDEELGPGITNGGEESLLSWQIKENGFHIGDSLECCVEHHLNPNRLEYAQWIKAAKFKGHNRAYLTHHWHHQTIGLPLLKQFYVTAKLKLRRATSKQRDPHSEGIPAWELSYLESIEFHSRYRIERQRPRNYNCRGSVKTGQAPTPIFHA